MTKECSLQNASDRPASSQGQPRIKNTISPAATSLLSEPHDKDIYVTRPDLPPLEALIPSLEKIWESRRLTNNGEFHRQFETALAEYLGVEHLSLYANCTLGLLATLRTLEISGEVITTPFSFVATSHVLNWNGLTPVFADIDPLTLNLDPVRVEAAITPRTTAILAVHCYGTPCDTAALQSIAERRGLRLLYDAAHAFGVKDADGPIVLAGDASILSFHATKVFNTFEGGAVVCKDAETKSRLDLVKDFGIVNEETVSLVGINAKMSEFSAALGLLQLDRFATAIESRRYIDCLYREALEGVRGIKCRPLFKAVRSNYGYFPIHVGDEYPLGRDGLYMRLQEAGIHARRYFNPLISQLPMYAGLPSSRPENLPVAVRVAREMLCLPIYPGLNYEQVARIAGIISGENQ